MIFSWAAVNCPWPRRLAGTCSAYSGRAISQLATMVTRSGTVLKRRWPYHATVMNALERISKTTVRMGPFHEKANGRREPVGAGLGRERHPAPTGSRRPFAGGQGLGA